MKSSGYSDDGCACERERARVCVGILMFYFNTNFKIPSFND